MNKIILSIILTIAALVTGCATVPGQFENGQYGQIVDANGVVHAEFNMTKMHDRNACLNARPYVHMPAGVRMVCRTAPTKQVMPYRSSSTNNEGTLSVRYLTQEYCNVGRVLPRPGYVEATDCIKD